MLHERGLAYQEEAEVNYDPVDKTVLANEQVDANGYSWRSGAKVEKKKLKQWFFRISEFREALLNDLEQLAKDNAWPERVLSQQKNWLGKSAGAAIKFPVMTFGTDVGAAIEVFTTRPDTLFGVQYIALSASHPVVQQLATSDAELQAFLDTLPGLPRTPSSATCCPNSGPSTPSPTTTRLRTRQKLQSPFMLHLMSLATTVKVPSWAYRDTTCGTIPSGKHITPKSRCGSS